MEKNVTFQNPKGFKLAATLTETSSKKFVLVMAHGFSSSKNTENFVILAQRLAEKGIATFRFDFFGHGESAGDFADITVSEAVDDVLQAIVFAKTQGYAKIGLLGSSFGGIASILAAAKTDGLSFLALKSPVSDYAALEKLRYSKKQLEKWRQTGHMEYNKERRLELNYSFIADMQNHDAYAAAKKIAVPTLIVHGNHDEEVPYSQSQKLVKQLPRGTLITINGANHRYTTSEAHTRQMLAAFTNFVVEQCQ